MYWFRFIHTAIFTFRLKVNEKSAAISYRAVWSRNDHNKAQLICKTRHLLEEQIRQISGIQFFISCVTGTTTALKLHQILHDLELHISLFSARIRKQTKLYYLAVSMIQEWTLPLPVQAAVKSRWMKSVR